jgi:N-acetylmuramoyl-L-alanine amidase
MCLNQTKNQVLTLAGIIFAFAVIGQPSPVSAVFDKVVIDAGHGGYDSGARGSVSKEKNITLAIALKTGQIINEFLPDIEVIFTRKSDVFVPLHRRADIANHNAADLFISIHCNSNTSPQPFGAETYVMGLHKTDENLEVAKTENMAILMEENYTENYDGFNPESDEDYILLNMFQHNSLEQSIHFSSLVQENLRLNTGLYDRGVKQAGFVVLYLTTMPGVLIETGFLSNPAEEQFLLNPENQNKIAEGIYTAIKAYKLYADALNESAILAKNRAGISVVQPESELYLIAFYQSKKLIPFDDPFFENLENIQAFRIDDYYIYTFGATGSISETKRILNNKRLNKGMRKRLKNAFFIPVTVNL